MHPWLQRDKKSETGSGLFKRPLSLQSAYFNIRRINTACDFLDRVNDVHISYDCDCAVVIAGGFRLLAHERADVAEAKQRHLTTYQIQCCSEGH